MQCSLPVMFIMPLLATAAAVAEPQEHGSHNQPNGGARYERAAERGNHQSGQPAGRGEQSGPAYRSNSSRPAEMRRPDFAAARGNERGAGRGSYHDARPGTRPSDHDYAVAPWNRDTGRGQVYVPRGGQWSNGDRPSRSDRPGGRYSDNRSYGRDDHRYAGWTRDHDDWRDERGRAWNHDRDWYDNYRTDHFRYFGNRYYAAERFSIGYYDPPWGYATRLWVRGDRLPLAWCGGRYLIRDYYDYDLYAPPYNAAWVRVGDDVLLIDMDDGDVLDVIADLFW
jgi:Ni/Co efflux regulator RcnB